MDTSIRIPLNLPNTRVAKISNMENGDWLIEVESTLSTTACRTCSRELKEEHGRDRPIRLRHLPLFEVPVYLELRPKRYRCPFCDGNPTSTQTLAWYNHRSPNTKAYEEWLLKILINSTVSDTARKLSLSKATVTGVLERGLAKEVDWQTFERLTVIGIDEIALKKGHRNYVALITTPTEDGVKLLGVLADRKQETVARFFCSIPLNLRGTIERVCSDMHHGFIRAVHEQLPDAKVVIDRFHVACNYRACADSVRKRETNRLKKELSDDEYDALKGVMWSFRKRPENLEAQESDQLAQLFSYSPSLEVAWILREELTDIFERDYTKAGAKCAMRAWVKRVRASGIQEFERFLKTLEKWFDEIANYFLEGWTSGFVEGFNNRVKVLKRRCYGIFDVKRIFQRLSLDIDGYEYLGNG